MSQKLLEGLVHKIPEDLAIQIHSLQLENLWNALTPIGRNEFLCWIQDAKQDKTKEKRLLRTLDDLQHGKKRPCCWPGCVHRTDKNPSQWQQDQLALKKK